MLLTSTHWPWIGERTRHIDGAHARLLARVDNPLSCKVGPSATPDDVVRLCGLLDPDRTPGRLTLIARMGADAVTERLPALVSAVRAAGHPVSWLSDPMHGNTVIAPGGVKTRLVDTVVREVVRFQDAVAAAGGIGSAVAEALAVSGASVALLDRDADQLAVVAKELTEAGRRATAFPVDVTSSEEVDAVVEEVEDLLGPVDRLVNAAGVLRTGRIDRFTDEDWQTTFAVNTSGVFHVSRAVVRRMMPRRRGALVTIASNAAGTARMEMAAYAASKAAVSTFTKCLGLESAEYGIRCNVVAPGSTSTPMLTSLWSEEAAARASIEGVPEAFRVGIPLGRVARPRDVANAVLFLLSDEAAHITMQHLTVDGGAALGA
ncbi:2,3-dihydro-2,3-dihydroxybenzoate dehydrogenase [Streptomyces colonosanans]|uniref:2,3-dihydro-2,3-dihydroxybenzoate dehydrogenase n=1 Tax=Streptomyces colonosanans TaxID=1428652 RepID=UPI0024820EAE|nr:2,3-dihydro-2,3-dihydroxybenzoate dehydrogenase [Streptomyces colonosanans]